MSHTPLIIPYYSHFCIQNTQNSQTLHSNKCWYTNDDNNCDTTQVLMFAHVIHTTHTICLFVFHTHFNTYYTYIRYMNKYLHEKANAIKKFSTSHFCTINIVCDLMCVWYGDVTTSYICKKIHTHTHIDWWEMNWSTKILLLGNVLRLIFHYHIQHFCRS